MRSEDDDDDDEYSEDGEGDSDQAYLTSNRRRKARNSSQDEGGNDGINDVDADDNGEGADYDSEEEDEEEGYDSQNEYAIDRAHKIGFFVDHFEFCMTLKDVRTVQRRFKLFHKNWREFQKKDLIVKKSVIVDDGATYQPRINKKSDQMVKNKEMGNLEFPLSTRNDNRSQRR